MSPAVGTPCKRRGVDSIQMKRGPENSKVWVGPRPHILASRLRDQRTRIHSHKPQQRDVPCYWHRSGRPHSSCFSASSLRSDGSSLPSRAPAHPPHPTHCRKSTLCHSGDTTHNGMHLGQVLTTERRRKAGARPRSRPTVALG